jgi:hypothetical protein
MSSKTPKPPEPLTKDDLLDILEKTTQSQLHALRALRPDRRPPPAPLPGERKSNISMVIDILKAAPGPLHISEILAQAQQRFGRKLSRESLVSALTKKVLDQQGFRRTAPNTFDLLHRP